MNEDPAILAECLEWARKLNDIVPTLPGYVSHKRFTADDGERCTIVEFATKDGHDAWAQHPVHVQAKALGQRKFFTHLRHQGGFGSEDADQVGSYLEYTRSRSPSEISGT